MSGRDQAMRLSASDLNHPAVNMGVEVGGVIRIFRLSAFAVAVGLGGCRHKVPAVEPAPSWRWAHVGTPCAPDAPAYSLPEMLRDTSAHPFGMAGINEWEERAAIARFIPGGWGGLSHREKDPRTVIYLVDTTQLTAAVPVLVARGILPANPRVGAIQGRWTYAQLYDWFRYIHTHIPGVRVTGLTLDESNNRILYGVEDEAAAADLNHMLTELHAPCFLVAVLIQARAHLLGRPSPT